MAKRNIRTIQYIEKTLRAADGPLSTIEIHLQICEKWPTRAPSMPRLGNLLARHKQFVKLDYSVGVETIQGGDSIVRKSHYNVHVWELSEDDSTRRDEKDGEGKNA